MTSIRLEIPRADLREIVKFIERGDVESAVEGLANIFGKADDLELQTFAILLDEIDGLPDGITDPDD